MILAARRVQSNFCLLPICVMISTYNHTWQKSGCAGFEYLSGTLRWRVYRDRPGILACAMFKVDKWSTVRALRKVRKPCCVAGILIDSMFHHTNQDNEMDGKMERSRGPNNNNNNNNIVSVSFSACFYKFSRTILILLENWGQLGEGMFEGWENWG